MALENLSMPALAVSTLPRAGDTTTDTFSVIRKSDDGVAWCTSTMRLLLSMLCAG